VLAPNLAQGQFKPNAIEAVKSVHPFVQQGPDVYAKGKFNQQSTAFNFYNKQIATEHGHPNVHSAVTSGTVYGGNIGAD
jgi:hypothetical protein